MKKRLLSICGFVALTLSLSAAELEAAYYAPIEGKRDSILKQTLHEIIQSGERYKYGSQSDQSVNLYTWNAFCLTDVRPDGTIWDMYSPYTHHFTYHNRGASGMAIEHSFPKSWWGWGIKEDETDFAYRDLYHLNPSEHRANGKKNDAMPGVTDSITEFDNGVFKVGYMKGQPYKRVFEPADYYKGDFARAYFYIATCYADYHWIDTAVVTSTGKIAKNTCGAYFAMTNDSYLAFKPWLQEMLVRWHKEDPVSAKELHRQDVISSIQKNRNPYIDYPELVEYIWGEKQGQAVSIANLTFTGSESYVPSLDTQNSIALSATDIHRNGFTAHWQDAGTDDYMLRVFSQDTIGDPDTLINMPGMKAKWVNDHKYMAWNGTNSTSDGDAGMTMGSASVDYTITISGLNIPANTVLIVRANISKYENTAASLKITIDGQELQTIALNFSETYYTIALPEGNHTFVLSQGQSKKRVCIQQLFVITNPLVITRNILVEESVTDLQYDVTLANVPTQTVYYTIAASGLAESQPIAVLCNDNTTPASLIFTQAVQILRDDNNLILQNIPLGTFITLYDISGRCVVQDIASASNITIPLQSQAFYILRVNNETHKILQ